MFMPTRLRAIAQWEVPLYWHRIEWLLKPVMERSEVDNTLEDVRQFLLTGNMQAWHVDWRVIVVTAIQPFGANAQAPTRRVCQIVYCSGAGLEDWLGDVVESLTDWASSMKCDCLRISGRRGWVKKLPEFHETCTTLERPICR
ncbi:MAG TPA: hypothetical protein VLV87_08690 [Gammaproteobacteria bacterium]|nr:hypothetical protein [Gammaproteobacteria bacterium]